MLTPDLSSPKQSLARAGLVRDSLLLGIVLVLFFVFAPATPAEPEQQRLKIAFEISTAGNFEAFVANVEGLQTNFGDLADITIVAASQGVELLRANDNGLQSRLAQLADRGVDFVVCQVGLQEVNLEASELVNFARTVKSGYAQLELLEKQGWARVRDGESYVSHL